jgi:hypothetical protein
MEQYTQQQSTSQPEKPKKGFYKKWWVWVIIIAILLLIFGYFVVVFYNRTFTDSLYEEEYWSFTSTPCSSDNDCIVSGCNCVNPGSEIEGGMCMPPLKCRCSGNNGFCQKKQI